MKIWKIYTIFFFLVLFGTAIVGRLVFVQILNHGFYKALAQGQQNYTSFEKGQRGNIYIQDKDGNLYTLATTRKTPFAFITPSEITDEQKVSLLTLEKILGVSFEDDIHLLTAITHRSYLNEHREAQQDHNERYEFLGDAVLELVVTDFLFQKYPEKPEGDLTAIRAALVNTVSLSEASTKLGVNDFLLLSKGEERDTGRARQYILANTFEALIGAIYLDQGYEQAKNFISKNLFPLTDEIVEKGLWQDSKSRFQEIAQEKESITPQYKTVQEVGPDHAKNFVVGVYLKDKKIGEGEGKSKQEAEQAAAQNALEVKGWA